MRRCVDLSTTLASAACMSTLPASGRAAMPAIGTACSPMCSPAPLQEAKRFQSFIPNKGYRTQPHVPDRLKDAMAHIGADMQNVTDERYVPEEQRGKMIQDVMNDTRYTRSYNKMDRLRAALDAVRQVPHDDPRWKEVYLFLRTTELCCEVLRTKSDVFPKGQKLWIEMQLCEEKRLPVLCELPNGMIVLPIFSMEEYMDEYFGRTDVYESCWFPSPRTGSRWEEFCKQEFPVCATGELQHHAMLSTVALDRHQLGILINPGQRTSKFLTYPEMVEMTKIKSLRFRERRSDIIIRKEDGTTESLFDPHLMNTYNTQKMPFKRVLPHELDEKLAKRAPIPPIAQLELHLLLESYEEITSVYIRTIDRPKWRQMLGSAEKMTQIDIVCGGAKEKPPAEFLDHLKRWSFLKEFQSDVHIELTTTVPVKQEGNEFMCVYTEADGDMLRNMDTLKSGMTLAESLGYNDPLVDKDGVKPYEANTYF